MYGSGPFRHHHHDPGHRPVGSCDKLKVFETNQPVFKRRFILDFSNPNQIRYFFIQIDGTYKKKKS